MGKGTRASKKPCRGRTEAPRLLVNRSYDIFSCDHYRFQHTGRIVIGHHFVKKIQLFIPAFESTNVAVLPPPLKSPPPFSIAMVQPLGFLDPDFLTRYVKQGFLYCVSVDSCVHRHNTCCIVHGKLYMSLDMETYLQSGLEGSRSTFEGVEFYIIESDLHALAFKAGAAKHERLRWCLSRMQPCRLIAAYYDPIAGACQPVEFPPAHCTGAGRAVCAESCTTISEDLRIPTLVEFKDAWGTEVSSDLFEWLGFLHGGFLSCIKCKAPADEFPTTLRSPQECDSVPGRGRVYEYRGFITSRDAVLVVKAAAAAVADGKAAWASVAMWGFEDTPIAWNQKQHSRSVGMQGDNHTVIVIKDDGNVNVTFQAVGDLDMHS